MKHFLNNEAGAVTVDWVVLTAALVGLGLAAMAVVSSGVEDVSGDTSQALQSNSIVRTNFNVAPTLVATGLANAWVSTPSCTQTPEGDAVCDPSISRTNERFWTNDGALWVRETERIDNGAPTVTWKDDTGREVAAHEVPDIPEDLPFSFDGNV